MTGEMHHINPKTGKDSNGDIWPLHAKIAQELNGEIKPFDVYQGPYIVFGADLTVGMSPYAMPVHLPGIVRLWIYENEKGSFVYREDTDESAIFWNENDIVGAAMELLRI
jgi:hypothetical protein